MRLHKHCCVRAIFAFSVVFLFIGFGSFSSNAASITELELAESQLVKKESELNERMQELSSALELKDGLTASADAVSGENAALNTVSRCADIVEKYTSELNAEYELIAAELFHVREELTANRQETELWHEERNEAAAAALANSSPETIARRYAWPMPGYTTITCGFENGHRGVDISGYGIYGEPILAADSGRVVYSGWMDSYGNCVFIDHGDGLITRYAHASRLVCCNGDYVTAGDVIAYVGSTGNSTGPHLHFEVINNGVLTDPLNMFL